MARNGRVSSICWTRHLESRIRGAHSAKPDLPHQPANHMPGTKDFGEHDLGRRDVLVESGYG